MVDLPICIARPPVLLLMTHSCITALAASVTFLALARAMWFGAVGLTCGIIKQVASSMEYMSINSDFDVVFGLVPTAEQCNRCPYVRVHRRRDIDCRPALLHVTCWTLAQGVDAVSRVQSPLCLFANNLIIMAQGVWQHHSRIRDRGVQRVQGQLIIRHWLCSLLQSCTGIVISCKTTYAYGA